MWIYWLFLSFITAVWIFGMLGLFWGLVWVIDRVLNR